MTEATTKLEITNGIYRHFKGGTYEVIGVGRHSETEEPIVVYKNAGGDIWLRPLDMFCQFVIHEGVQMQRFTLIEEIQGEVTSA